MLLVVTSPPLSLSDLPDYVVLCAGSSVLAVAPLGPLIAVIYGSDLLNTYTPVHTLCTVYVRCFYRVKVFCQMTTAVTTTTMTTKTGEQKWWRADALHLDRTAVGTAADTRVIFWLT